MTHKTVAYTYGTGNPVQPNGSGDVRDGIDNLQSFDIFMNDESDTYNQRDGDIVPTVAGLIRNAGFVHGSGDFTTGFTVMPGQRNHAWYDPVSKNWYAFMGSIPESGYVVAPGTNPAGDVNWKPVTDYVLRSDLNEGFGGIYRRQTTVSEISTGIFPVGARLTLTDRPGADFDVVSGGSANNFDILDAGPGRTAMLVIRDRTVNCRYLGMTPSADNKNALLALNSLITAGKVRKVLMTEVYNTSDEYTVPTVPASISYIGLHGGIKPQLSGLKFTHSDPLKDGWKIPNRFYPVHLESLCSIGNSAGRDGFHFEGEFAANYTASSLYSRYWSRDGFYINNLFICRFANLMSEDTGRDGIHLIVVNEVQFPGFSVERAARWGVYNEDGFINTGTGNCSDCGTGGTGGGFYTPKGASNDFTLYYEAPAAGRSHTAFAIGGKAINTRITARVSQYDTWEDEGMLSEVITGQGGFDADPRSLALNINNPCFEIAATGTSGWISSQGSVSFSRVNDGYSGNYSLQAAITGTSGNANFYTNGAGYNYDVGVDQTIYASFAIKTSRNIGVNGYGGEFLLVEFIGMDDAEPSKTYLLPVTRAGRWRKMSFALNADMSATNVRMRFVLSGLTANVNVQVTDIVFTTSLTKVKITPRPDSTASDVATLKTDFNLLLAQMRNNGLIARS